MLDNTQIQNLAPSVFTKTSSDNVSDKYTHIPTYKVMEDMRLLGWQVTQAKEVKARKGIGFQKHLLVFQNPDLTISDGNDVVKPQILLSNSHDGKNSFIFRAGLFRLICENGLVIATQDFENMKIRHMNYTFEELQTVISSMVEKLPLTIESMNKMKEIELDQEQIVEFAKRSIECRFGKEKSININIDFDEFTTPVRTEDDLNNLWTTYNVIQEKLIRGDFKYINEKGKSRKARPIKSFNQDVEVNERLFELALQYS